MDVDPRVRLRYEAVDENDRLWRPGLGELVRHRYKDRVRAGLAVATRDLGRFAPEIGCKAPKISSVARAGMGAAPRQRRNGSRATAAPEWEPRHGRAGMAAAPSPRRTGGRYTRILDASPPNRAVLSRDMCQGEVPIDVSRLLIMLLG